MGELKSTTGAVDRQAGGQSDWARAALGTRYYLDDATRVQNGDATVDIIGGAAHIVMRDGSTLRFRGTPMRVELAVEAGAVDLGSTASYALDVVKLPSGTTVEITPTQQGTARMELKVGTAEVKIGDEVVVLDVGTPHDLIDLIGPQRLAIDAGVRGVPAADARTDAPITADANQAAIEVTGKRADLLAPGQAAWRPLPPGAAPLARGSAVRLGPGTTAKVTGGSVALDLGSGARLRLDAGDALAFALEAGGAQAVATGPATLGLPGGAVALGGPGTTPSAATESRVDAGPRDTRVAMLRGGAVLTGEAGAELTMARGETALLTRGGAIRVVEAIPRYFDLRASAGESFTIHDPRPPSAVQFQFDDRCPEGGIIELDRDARFRTAKVSAGHDFASILLPAGAWAYRLRCTSNGGEGAAVASGRISVVRDDGRRPLPPLQSVNDIDADGRNYRISYQSAIPTIVVHLRNPGAVHRLHLASAGKEQTFDASSSSITVPGAQLREGTYSYWVDRDGVRGDRVSTLTIDFDQTAPQVYIESPNDGQPWNGDIDVRGAVLPGWSAAVDDIAIPIDRQRRFSAKVGAPGGRALAIRLSHPQRGVHYYLRRTKVS
jgi:hypothetical protein